MTFIPKSILRKLGREIADELGCEHKETHTEIVTQYYNDPHNADGYGETEAEVTVCDQCGEVLND